MTYSPLLLQNVTLLPVPSKIWLQIPSLFYNKTFAGSYTLGLQFPSETTVDTDRHCDEQYQNCLEANCLQILIICKQIRLFQVKSCFLCKSCPFYSLHCLESLVVFVLDDELSLSMWLLRKIRNHRHFTN